MGYNATQAASPTRTASVAKADKSVAKQEDAGGLFTRAIFNDKCKSDNRDNTFIPKSTVCFIFVMVCCVLYPALTLLLTAIRFKNTPANVRADNRAKLFASIGLQIFIPIMSGLIMYGAYDTCNALYAYAIGVIICTLSWFLNVFWLLSKLDSAW
jgi:uncharacterized membrane protein